MSVHHPSGSQQRAPALTGDGHDGFPSETAFREQMEDYLSGLNPKKRAKALMSREMYATILAVLLEPHSTAHATAQFRFWAKRMFRLVTTPHANLVAHENRPVAVKDQIYHILVGCHGDTNHSGRDKTSAQVRRYYSWLPKELVSRFVKMCPTCINKRRQQQPYLSDSYLPAGSFGIPRRIGVTVARPTTSYSEAEPDSPDRYDAGSSSGQYATYTPSRRTSYDPEAYNHAQSYEQQGQYEQQQLGDSSPASYGQDPSQQATSNYSTYYIQPIEGDANDTGDYSLPVPPSLHNSPNRRASKSQPQPTEPFYYQDENGQTFVYDCTGALIQHQDMYGAVVPSGEQPQPNYPEQAEANQQELLDYSTWQLPPSEVDVEAHRAEYAPSADGSAQPHQPQHQQHELSYELPPLPASAPPYQLSHFPEAEVDASSHPAVPQVTAADEFEYHPNPSNPAEDAPAQQRPIDLALYSETQPTDSNPPATVRRAKPPPLDLGKSSNLFPTTLDPAFRRSATTGVPQFLSPSYNHLDVHSAPLSAPLQRTSASQLFAFRDPLPSPGPSSACSTASTIFSTASSLPLTPGTSWSTNSNSASSAMGGGCSDQIGEWQHDSQQLEQAIRLLYDSHIETSGGGAPVDGQQPQQQQQQHSQSQQQHDALLAQFLGGNVNLDSFDEGLFAFSGAPPPAPRDDGSEEPLSPVEDRQQRQRMRTRTRTVSAGPTSGYVGGATLSKIEAHYQQMGSAGGHASLRTPTKDSLRYMPY
ncbi:hypothetical protein JCM5296_006829 [Sporobolomyces johnsonii]